MNTSDDNITPGQPGEDESLTDLFRDVFDRIDETVAGITDAEVEQRMQQALFRAAAGTGFPEPPDTGNAPAASACEWAEAGTVLSAARHAAAEIITGAWRQAKFWAAEAQSAARAASTAQRDADQIIAGARRHADAALDRAAEIVSRARQDADQIIAEARENAELITAEALGQAQLMRARMAAAEHLTAPGRPRQSDGVTGWFSPAVRTVVISVADLDHAGDVAAALTWQTPSPSPASLLLLGNRLLQLSARPTTSRSPRITATDSEIRERLLDILSALPAETAARCYGDLGLTRRLDRLWLAQRAAGRSGAVVREDCQLAASSLISACMGTAIYSVPAGQASGEDASYDRGTGIAHMNCKVWRPGEAFPDDSFSDKVTTVSYGGIANMITANSDAALRFLSGPAASSKAISCDPADHLPEPVTEYVTDHSPSLGRSG